MDKHWLKHKCKKRAFNPASHKKGQRVYFCCHVTQYMLKNPLKK